MYGLIIIVALLALLWVLMIRPQRRRQQEQADMLSDLAIGDEILTAGGIYGRIEEIGAADVTVEVAPGTSIRMAKRAVAAVIPDEEEEEEDVEEEPPDEEAEAEDSAEKPTSAAETHR